MPVAKQEWERTSDQKRLQEQAHGQRDFIMTVYEILEESAPRAYCIDDFFRAAGPGGPREHGLLEALKRAALWQMSRKRSKVRVEAALETLVVLEEVEKRAVPHNGEPVTHYRMKPTVERGF